MTRGLFDHLCPHCGEPEEIELLEIYGDTGEFMISTCCEGTHEAVVDAMNRDPDYAAELLRELGAEDYVGSSLRRVPACDGQFLLDFNLEIREIERDEARAFVADHHKHNAAPVGWRYGAGIWNGRQLIGVVMVGRPVARMLDHTRIVEVNRLCVRRDIAPALVWNACSQLYGWAAREAKKRGFDRIITYTLETEPGTALRAAGWTKAPKPTKGGSWNRPSRARGITAPTCRKWRYERSLAA